MQKSSKSHAAARGAAEPQAKSIPILVVDDHPLIRSAIRSLVEAQVEKAVCIEAASAKEALAKAAAQKTAAAIVDVSLPDKSGIDLIRSLKMRHPQLAVLVYSMHDESLYAEQAMRAGAGGYVMKDESPERLIEGLRAVLRGEMFVSPKLTAMMLGAYVRGSRGAQVRASVDLLSERELQIFDGIGRGLSTQQIARKYTISAKTVETYRSHIKTKLGLSNGHELVQSAVRWVEREAAGGKADTPRFLLLADD